MKHLIPDMDFELYEIDLDYVSDIIDHGYRSLEKAERAYNRRIAMASSRSSSSSHDYSGRDSYSGGGGSSHSSGGSSAGGSSGGGFR